MTGPSASTVATGIVVAIIGFSSSFAIVLQGLTHVGADPAQASSGLMAAAVAMGLAGIGLSLWTKAPVSVAWSTPGAALLATAAPVEGGFSAAVGAFLIAGALTVAAGLWRPLQRLIGLIPAALAHAMLAGVLLPLCLAPVRVAAEAPLVAGPIILTWLIVGEINRLFAVPAAVLATIAVIGFHGDLSSLLTQGVAPAPVWIDPIFSLDATIGLALPLFIVTMATQNAPGLAVMRSHGYTPESGPLLAGVGAFSMLSAPLGAHATCLAAITAAMCANEDADPDPARRYWSAVVAGLGYIALGLCAGLAIALFALAPAGAIATLAGVGLIGVLANSTQAALSDPQSRHAAIVTFVISGAGITILGVSGAFWGLILGGALYAIRKARA